MTMVNRPRGGPLGASGLRTPSQRYVCVYPSLSMKGGRVPSTRDVARDPRCLSIHRTTTFGASFYDPLTFISTNNFDLLSRIFYSYPA